MTDKSKDWFDVSMDIVDGAIRKGYVQAWFSWLGWVTVSSVLYVLGSKAGSLEVQVLGIVSIIVTLLAGLVGVEKLRDDWLDTRGEQMPKWLKLSTVLSIAMLGLYIVTEIIGVVVKVTLTTNGLS